MLVCFILDVNASMGQRSPPSGPHATTNLRGAGLSSFEWAKAAVEYFIKARQKTNMKDQYFLVTTEEGPGCVKISWGDSLQRFDDNLRLLAPLPADGSKGGTNVGHALSMAFALLNQYRLQHGIDNYGQGRCPWLVEPGCCLLFTGGNSSRPTSSSVQKAIGSVSPFGGDAEAPAPSMTLQLTCSAHDLTRDPYRWDQRFFPFIIHHSPSRPLADSSSLDDSKKREEGSSTTPSPVSTQIPYFAVFKALADATGGYCSVSESLMGLTLNTDLVMHKLAFVGPMVVLAPDLGAETCGHATKSAQAQSRAQEQEAGRQGKSQVALYPPETCGEAFHSPHLTSPAHGADPISCAAAVRAILCLNHESAGFSWPIPEAFWVDRTLEHLPKRDAHPILLYSRLATDSTDAALASLTRLEAQGLTMDRYPLEWCGGGAGAAPSGGGLRMTRGMRWPVYLMGSGRMKGSRGCPFGFLEASDVAGRVTLVLLPYDYPKLVELVQVAVEGGSASGHLTSLPVKWRPEFNSFLAQTPPYYFSALRRCLKKVGLHTQVPEQKTGGLSQLVIKRLQRIREQARADNQRYEMSRREHPHNRGLEFSGDMGTGASGRDGLEGGGSCLAGGKGNGEDGRETSEEGAESQDERLFDPSKSLLSMWEGLRQGLFGEGDHVISGLYVRGFQSWQGACGQPKNGRRRPDEWMLLQEVGALQMPEIPINEMGAYSERLLQMEVFRDPLDEYDPDDDTPEAWKQRKLAVNFGNPFRRPRQHHVPHVEAQHAGDGKDEVGQTPNRGVLSAEADNEAEVLGPHSSLGEDLPGKWGKGDEAFVYGSDAWPGGVQRRAEGEAGSALLAPSTAEQPHRKRRRLNELPPLPTGRPVPKRHRSRMDRKTTPRAAPPARSVGTVPTAMSSQPLSPLPGPLAPLTPEENDHWSDRVAEEGISETRRKEDPVAVDTGGSLVGPGAGVAASEAVTSLERKSSNAPHKITLPGASTIDPTVSNVRGPDAPHLTSHPPSQHAAIGGAPKRSIEEMLKDRELVTPNAEGWMLAWSKREKRLYYFNIKTNVAVWTAPPGLPAINEDT